MSYKALYRKWRPLVFDDIVEQEHVVKTLKYSVSTGRIAHAYLFCGTRGTGKTTTAHILSRAINCLNPKDGDPCNQCEICKGILSGSILDVLEIDAASNNSVDNVREIRDEVVYAPSRAKYKVYIVDEVHMLSPGAFNALLKTLEEPPEHVVFILATTEPHKLPVTILSRCQRFEFRRISVESISNRLNNIAKAHNTVLHEEASRLIARMADGALRDAISLLDQCMSLGKNEISYDDVLSVVGIVNDTFIADVVNAVSSRNMEKLFGLVDRLVMDGKDIVQFVSDLIFYYRNLLICKISKNPGEVVEVSKEVLDVMIGQSKDMDRDEIIYIIKELSSLESGLKWSAHPRILLEVALVKICENYMSPDNDDILSRLSALERKINSGNFIVETSPEKSTIEKSKSEEVKGDEQGNEKSKSTQKHKKSPNKINSLDIWKDILNELKNMGRMGLYTNLIDAKAVELDNGALGILFSHDKSFNKMIASKAENIEVIQQLASKKLGREVTVKCIDEDSYVYHKKDDGEEKDDFLEKAQDLAKKLDVPLNVIDE